MTAGSTPSSAAERLIWRGIGGALALLVQVAAVLLFALLLLLPQIREAAPVLPAPAVARPQRIAPAAPPAPSAPPPAAPSLAPPSGLAGFGRALFGCAPEDYANLSPDERARCAKPAEGLALQRNPDLMGTPSHVKDEAHWQAELARKNSPLMLCPSLSPGCLAVMILSGRIADPRTWPYYETRRYGKEDFYKIQQAYDQWHKDHPVK